MLNKHSTVLKNDKINVCAKGNNIQTYINKLKKIQNEDEFNTFFQKTSFDTIPFFCVPRGHKRREYYNLAHLTLASRNVFLLEKILSLRPEIMNEYFYIDERTQKFPNIEDEKGKPDEYMIRDFKSNDSLFTLMPDNFIEQVNQALSYKKSILETLNKYNSLEPLINNIIGNFRFQHDSKVHTISRGYVDFIFDNKLPANNKSIYLMYAKNYGTSYKMSKEAYNDYKDKFSYFIKPKNDNDFFDNPDIFQRFFYHPTPYFFKEFFDYFNSKSKDKIEFFDFDPAKYDSHDTVTLMKNNNYIDFIKAINPLLDGDFHPLKQMSFHKQEDYEKIVYYYSEAFIGTKQDYVDIYKHLNTHYGFSLKPHEVNHDKNLSNLKIVIEMHKNPLRGTDLEYFTNKEVKYNNFNALKKVLSFSNIKPTETVNSVIKSCTYFDNHKSYKNMIDFLDYVYSNKEKLGINISDITVSGDKNTAYSIIEKHILKQTLMAESTLLPSPAKKRL